MKKIILAAALFVSIFAQAQILVFDGETQLENGATYTYNVLGEAAKMHLLVQNDTNEEINVKLKMLDIQNSDGTEVQFCYGGLCLNSATVNSITPSGPPSVATFIPAGGNNAGEYAGYFYNQHPITNGPITYTMGLFHIDAAGVPTGDPIVTFNYKYDPTAATTDFASLERMGILVNSTVVKNTLDVTANQNAKLQIVNINGQIVKSVTIANGPQSIDLSSTAAGVYFARFTTEENKAAQIKFVKN